MAKVVIVNPFEKVIDEVEVPAGTTLLEAARQCGSRMGSNCGGVCACSTCHSYVKEGADALSGQQDLEADRLDLGFDVRANSRLGCQAMVERADARVVIELSQESLQAFYDEHADERQHREGRRLAAKQKGELDAP